MTKRNRCPDCRDSFPKGASTCNVCGWTLAAERTRASSGRRPSEIESERRPRGPVYGRCAADIAPTIDASEIDFIASIDLSALPNAELGALDVISYPPGDHEADALSATQLTDVDLASVVDASNVDLALINDLLSSPLPDMLEDIPPLNLHVCDVQLKLVDAPHICAICGRAPEPRPQRRPRRRRSAP